MLVSDISLAMQGGSHIQDEGYDEYASEKFDQVRPPESSKVLLDPVLPGYCLVRSSWGLVISHDCYKYRLSWIGIKAVVKSAFLTLRASSHYIPAYLYSAAHVGTNNSLKPSVQLPQIDGIECAS